jgi:hypothetical protein
MLAELRHDTPRTRVAPSFDFRELTAGRCQLGSSPLSIPNAALRGEPPIRLGCECSYGSRRIKSQNNSASSVMQLPIDVVSVPSIR